MKLSDKLRQLQEEANNGELTQDGIEDGFNRCIEDAEDLEEMVSKSEVIIVEQMQSMCEQSLCPETFQKWEDVKSELEKRRKQLKQS